MRVRREPGLGSALSPRLRFVPVNSQCPVTGTALTSLSPTLSVWSSPGSREAEAACPPPLPKAVSPESSSGVCSDQVELPSAPDFTLCGAPERSCHLNALSPFPTLHLCPSSCLWSVSGPGPGACSCGRGAVTSPPGPGGRSLRRISQRKGRSVWLSEQGWYFGEKAHQVTPSRGSGQAREGASVERLWCCGVEGVTGGDV